MQDPAALVNGGVQFPEEEKNLRCPRCESTNTKFCYYNNYNLSQPRHFCKDCRRYWTKGGALRKVPVGGATRKSSKRRNSAASSEPKTTSCSAVDAAVPPQLPRISCAPLDGAAADRSGPPGGAIAIVAPPPAEKWQWVHYS